MILISDGTVDAFAVDFENDNGDLETFGIYLTKEEAWDSVDVHRDFGEDYQIRPVKAQIITKLMEVD